MFQPNHKWENTVKAIQQQDENLVEADLQHIVKQDRLLDLY